MATYVVGDIQGCCSALKTLLNNIQFNPSKDTLWAVGDLIGRGAEALETLSFLYDLGTSFNTVLGNHDLHFLAVFNGIKKVNPKDKFESLLSSQRVNELVNWLRIKPLAYPLTEDIFLSHAGLYPNWTPKQALGYAQEVSDYLQSDNWIKLLRFMYGSKCNRFAQDLSEMERLRFTIDAFTRMRYLCEDGSLELQCKESIETAPNHLIPWFEHKNIKNNTSTRLVFGHWASLEGRTPYEHCIALDTGYVWGGNLSIFCLESRIFSSLSQ